MHVCVCMRNEGGLCGIVNVCVCMNVHEKEGDRNKERQKKWVKETKQDFCQK